MDCDSCGRHRPSDQVVPARASNGAVLMLCGSCRRHVAVRSAHVVELRPLPGTARHPALPAA